MHAQRNTFNINGLANQKIGSRGRKNTAADSFQRLQAIASSPASPAESYLPWLS